MARWPIAALAPVSICLANAALAAPIPEPVSDMIEEAAKRGDADLLQSTVDLAKATHPNSAAEIDALLTDLKKRADDERIAKLKSTGPLQGWSGEIEAGASQSTGTSKNTTLALGVNLKKEGLKWRHKMIGVANFESTDEVTTAERYLASYEANYKITPRFFTFGLLQWERDEFAGFDRRYTESVGLGYTLVDLPTLNWQVSGGPAFRQTEFVTDEKESDISARLSTLLRWDIAANTVFTEDAGAYLGGASSTYYSTTALTTRLIKSLSGRASFNVTSESDPPPGIASTTTISRLTLVYGF